MTLYMCYTKAFVMVCTIHETLAQIDHQGTNFTFLTLDMAFGLNIFISKEKGLPTSTKLTSGFPVNGL